MIKKNIWIFLLAVLCFSCERSEHDAGIEPDGEAVHFMPKAATPYTTRADGVLDKDGITIIAPGYGTGAANQQSTYKSVLGIMEPSVVTDPVIRWSAKNMVFTAWLPVEGVTVAEDGTGTVDFTKDLDWLIGAHAEKEYTRPVPGVDLEFHHLVTKFTITLENVASESFISPGSTITFPAIKQMGEFKGDLRSVPTVSTGKAGNELTFEFDKDKGNGIWELVCFMPPLTANDILMYGSFTIKDGSTTYVGTLKSMNLVDSEGKEAGINPGDHYSFKIEVNDDHTTLIQAVTLAPWDVFPDNVYNRPSPGIWGMEDLQALYRIINGEETKWNDLTINELTDNNGVIRVFTDIIFEEGDEFAPIGTETHPFTGYVFDGNGYTVSGISLKNTSSDNQGLFGVVADNVEIKNITVKNTLIEGNNNTGVLVGRTNGNNITIGHCFVSGSEVIGKENVGGLIGHANEYTLIVNCSAGISTLSGSDSVGGLVGLNEGIIGNSYSNTGSIICYGVGGGFVGKNLNVICNSYSCAAFSYGTDDCGAFAGYHIAGKEMDNCYWNTECINNTSCSKVVGNSTYNQDGVEVKPNGFKDGMAFNKSNGQIIVTNSYIPLYDRLNNYIISNSSKSEKFLRWARISGNNLPVFGY